VLFEHHFEATVQIACGSLGVVVWICGGQWLPAIKMDAVARVVVVRHVMIGDVLSYPLVDLRKMDLAVNISGGRLF
jgi:hypothetical protein